MHRGNPEDHDEADLANQQPYGIVDLNSDDENFSDYAVDMCSVIT